MQLTIPNVFANGTGESNIVDAPKMNANFDAIVAVLNGNIEADNIKTGAQIAIKNLAQTIAAIWTFTSNPVFNAGGIADAALTSNVPLKNAANTFDSKQTFSAKIDMSKTEIEQPVFHKLASAPSSPVVGQMYYNTSDNHPYIWSGSAWVLMDYAGGYTGGAVRGYTSWGIVDSNDSSKVWFKTEGASPVVKVAIKGERFPIRFYTELGEHTHVFTGTTHTHSETQNNHYHNVTADTHTHGTSFGSSTHTHTLSSGSTGSASPSNHRHGGVTDGTDYSDYEGAHTHSLSGNSGVPSATASVSNTVVSMNCGGGKADITIGNTVAAGTNAVAGVNGGILATVVKAYGESLQVKIDGTDVTSNILSATGWSKIGDGTDAHAFQTTGTGELTATAWKSYSAGFHTIEIIEPTAGYGCSYIIHIETY
jgi:hypothetical protein